MEPEALSPSDSEASTPMEESPSSSTRKPVDTIIYPRWPAFLDASRITWLLPKMKENRTESELEIRYFIGNENNKDSFRGYVFFSWSPRECSSQEIYCGRHDQKYVFSSSSEEASSDVVIVFKPKKPPPTEIDVLVAAAPPLIYMDLQIRVAGCLREKNFLSSGLKHLKHKLIEQEHRPNTDLNLLTAAYDYMNSHVSTSNQHAISMDSYVSTSNQHAIYKQRTPLGNTVLHLAAAYGNNAMVDRVAQQAPYLFTVTNNNYDTALHAAAKAGHASTIQFLLNTWLPIVRRETDGHPKYQQPTLQMMLLVSLTLLRNKQGNTFFHEAFMVDAHNGAHIFKAFQDSFMKDSSELDVDFKKIVNHLIVFAVNWEGKSLLYMAMEVGCNQVVQQLLDICNQYDPKPEGKSPFLPALINKNINMLQTILDKKPKWIHLRNEEGMLPLHHAASMGYHEGVSYLVESCSSCTMERNNYGFFPIHLACIRGHIKVVEELLKYCPDPTEMLDKNGRTLLHVAIKWGKYELVRYILQHPKLEFMINQKDSYGNTPLHLATLNWHPKIVHSLTRDNKVNLTILNQENQTALDITELKSDKSSSLAQRLTWMVLQSAGTPRSSAGSLLSNDSIVGEEESSRSSAQSLLSNDSTVGEEESSRSSARSLLSNDTKVGEKKESSSTEQYKDRIDTLILVSTLIITASFAAGFSVPGDVDQGTAVMLNHVMFHLFILSLTISIFGAIITTIILMWAHLNDLHLMLFALKRATPVLSTSLMALSLAFLAGVYLVVSKLSWLATTFLVLSVILILIIVVLLYTILWPSSSTIPVLRHISDYLFLLLVEIAEGKIDVI